MDINQRILKKNNIFEIIEKIVENNEYNINHSLFYPQKIDWYKFQFEIIKEIVKDKKLLKNLKSMIYYKINGYYQINRILINKSFPFIYQHTHYEQSLYNKNLMKTNSKTKPIFLFPNDISKISLHKQQKLLSHIHNIDTIFSIYKKYLLLNDCILFRGMYDFNNNLNNNDDFLKIFHKMTKNYEYKVKNKIKLNKVEQEITFDNYVSTTFNIQVSTNFSTINYSSNFSNSSNNNNSNNNSNMNNIFLILNIKKEHKVPGIYLSSIFFDNINNINNINNNELHQDFFNKKDYESEVLIHRNFKIKIKKIKNIYQKKKFNFKIKELFDNKNKQNNIKNNKQKIKIVYAESCPFTFPEKFVPKNNPKYFCLKI
jgi:hypothetical protein